MRYVPRIGRVCNFCKKEFYIERWRLKDLKQGIDAWKEEREKIFSKYGWSIIFIPDYDTNKKEHLLKILKGGD